jgi:signal transduction histidine kinase
MELRRARVDLAALVRAAGEDHVAFFAQRGLELAVAVPGEPAWMDGDPTRIAQLVGNLLQNAARYTPRGGKVALSVAVAAGGAELRVSDSGAGIAPELLGRVFEAFEQGTPAGPEGGLGLGLALVKGIAELHGGTARAESAGAGRGAEFVVALPLARA